MITLINDTLAGAVTGKLGEAYSFKPHSVQFLTLQAVFVRAGGGTTCDVFVQTSLDGGVTWFDIAQFAFTTTTATKVSAVKRGIAVTPGTAPADAALADNTVLDGVIGDRVRVKYTTTGTYTGASSVKVTAIAA